MKSIFYLNLDMQNLMQNYYKKHNNKGKNKKEFNKLKRNLHKQILIKMYLQILNLIIVLKYNIIFVLLLIIKDKVI